MSPDDPLTRAMRKLQSRADLDEVDREAILGLPYVRRTYDTPAYLVREGENALRGCSFIVSGFAIRHKLTMEGARQIVSINMAGDFLDLQHLFLSRADHNIQALTRLEVIEIGREAWQDAILRRPNIGRAMWIDGLVDSSIFREWILNVGRRDARGRVAHLLCEFAARMRAAGLGDGQSYELPMTQEQIGDAVGLTSVHVNRTLRTLAEEGLVERHKRHLRFTNWERIRDVADFSALYLHQEQGSMGEQMPPATLA